jgi:hypothetical protein
MKKVINKKVIATAGLHSAKLKSLNTIHVTPMPIRTLYERKAALRICVSPFGIGVPGS